MPQTLILAKNTRQANRFAKSIGLQRFSYRAVQKAGSIRAVRHAEVYLLKPFLERYDRHQILAALKNARTLTVYYVDLADFEESDPADITGDEASNSLNSPVVSVDLDISERDLEVAYRYNALRSASSREQIESLDPDKPEWLAELEKSGAIEPEGFALSDDPKIAATQILESAAHFAEEPSEPTPTPEPSEDPAPAEEPKPRRRRSRCKDCEQLHYSDEPCPAPGGAAEPVASEPPPAPPAPVDFFG